MKALTTLVVSADPAVRDSIREMLEAENLHAETFPSLDAMQDAVAPDVFGCLVLDVQVDEWCELQSEPGLAFCGSATPVVILTDRGDVVTAVRALKSGAVDVVEKPFSNTSLLQSIRQILKWQSPS